jgi:hypothetical protein
LDPAPTQHTVPKIEEYPGVPYPTSPYEERGTEQK